MRAARSFTEPATVDTTVNTTTTDRTGKKHSQSSGDAPTTTVGLGEGTSAACLVDGGSLSPGLSVNLPQTERSPQKSSYENTKNNIQGVASNIICNPLRTMVSQNRRRFIKNGYNLDLTYITDRIIAMGYPADTTEAIYRNSMTETKSFLEAYHKDHYKVFNLRGSYVYDAAKFHNRVMSFEMTDHHPPRLELMAPFCREVHEYLESDSRNVVAVHCKAGKGRTGVMICAYLVYVSFYPFPRQNMDYYSIVRTKNNKGVTIPSQRRYVYYFDHLRRHKLNYMPLRIELVGVYLERPPKSMGTFTSKSAFCLRVANGDVDVFLGPDLWMTPDDWNAEEEAWSGNVVAAGEDSFDVCQPREGADVVSRRAWGWTVPADRRVFLEGDVRIDIFSQQKLVALGYNQKRKKMGHFWWNTMFACAGFCGGVYRHGDEAHPYPVGATTIAEPKVGHRPKTGSASLPSSPPGERKTRGAPSASSQRSPRVASRTPSFDARHKFGAPRLSQVVRRLADAAGRNSEPTIERSEEKPGGLRRRVRESKDRAQSVWDEDMQLMLPPGLDKHCPNESLELIYHQNDLKPPRVDIEEMLKDAHKRNIIEDNYNHRRLSVPQEGDPVSKVEEGRPQASGPNLIRRGKAEHVQVFSALEIDRAFKNKHIGEGFKVIVVTRCVAPDNVNDVNLAETFLRISHQKQAEKDKRKHEMMSAKSGQKLAGVSSGASLTDHDTSRTATEDSNLLSTASTSDPRKTDPFMSRFFHRQREDSISVYPNHTYRCPLLGETPMAENSSPEDFSAPPMPSLQSGETWSSSVGLDPGSVHDFNELDTEVRSYHPDDCQSEEFPSGSSRSSSSSEDAAAVGTSSCVIGVTSANAVGSST